VRTLDELERLYPERRAAPQARGTVDLLVVRIASGQHVGAALLEVTPKPHSGCKKFLARFGAEALAWINEERGRARKLRGINCRVIEAGVIRAGDTIEIER
jgi:MOSC domain-containing protein YiiM